LPALAWQVLTLGVAGASLVLIALRILAIARRPIHLRWELAPVPYERKKDGAGGSYLEEYEWWTKARRHSTTAALIYTASEIFLQRSVWRHNRGLWPLTFVFHIGLYLTAGLALGLTILAVLMALGLDFLGAAPLREIVSVLALLGYLLGGAGAAGLLLKRALDPGLRPFNTIARTINLLFLGAVFLSGLYAWLRTGDYAAEVGRFAHGVITLDRNATVESSFSIHLAISLLFLLYLPLTDMIHFIAKYFTYHLVRWDDQPQNDPLERKLRGLMSQPVTWSASHIRSSAERTWEEIASAESGSEKTA
jgi:nitrate reductase gamma subunit